MFKYCVAVFVLIFQIFAANAAAERPLKELISYEDFKSLILFNTGRVPEFKGMWEASDKIELHTVYWTGGSMRGFLRWHYLKLQNFSTAELRTMPPPTLDEIQKIGGEELDIVSRDRDAKALKNALPAGEEVDSISLDVFKDLNEVGGPTIEKMGLNSKEIFDPYGALESYYKGLLVFKVPARDIFQNHRVVVEGDYSKTVSAIRFARFLHTLPELTADPKSVDEIRQIAKEEADFIKDSYRSNWAVITLKKFVDNVDGDIGIVVKDLVHFNLIGHLSDAGIWLKSDISVEELFSRGKVDREALSPQQVKQIKNFVRVSPVRRAQSFFKSLVRSVLSCKRVLKQ